MSSTALGNLAVPSMDDEGNVNQGEQSPRDEEAPVEPQ